MTATRRQRHAGLGIAVTCIPARMAGSRTDFVLVHGIGVSSRYFGPLAAELTRLGAVRLIDLPGYGAAPPPRRDVALDDHAQVLASVLRGDGGNSESGRRHVLVGHSMGSQVVAAVAERHPELVDRIVLMAPTTPPRSRSRGRALRDLMRDVPREPPAVLAITMVDYLVRCGVPYLLRQLPHMLADALEHRMPRITVPVLVIHGDRDPVVDPRWARGLAEAAPEGRYREVAGPHVVMHSDPAAVAAHIVEFARPAPPGSAASPSGPADSTGS